MSNMWLGSNYAETRLLLLGESAHTWEEDGKTYQPGPDHARGLVEDIIEKMSTGKIKKENRFMVMLSRGLCGEECPDRTKLEGAWARVAFANYVGEAVSAARVSPTSEMWEKAEKNFPAILEELHPRNVIVLGERMWGKMPSAPLWLTNDVQGYEISENAFAICWNVSHPTASKGLSWRRLASLVTFVCEGKVRL